MDELITPSPEPVAPIARSSSVNPLLLIVTLISISAAGYFGFQYWRLNQIVKVDNTPYTPTTSVPSSSPVATSSSTFSDWEKYTDSDFRFSFNHPQTWVITDSFPNSVSLKTPTGNFLKIIISTDTSPTIATYLAEADKISQTGYEGTPSLEVHSTKKTIINTLNSIQREEYLPAADINRVSTYFKSSQIVVNISLEPTPGNALTNDRLIYDQLLSTFRFGNESVPQKVSMGSISGRLCYPGSYIPPGEIMAKNTDSSKIYSTRYEPSNSNESNTYTLEVPAGKYHLQFKTDKGVIGYFTYCATHLEECTTKQNHLSLSVNVTESTTTSKIDLCDFYYDVNPEF